MCPPHTSCEQQCSTCALSKRPKPLFVARHCPRAALPFVAVRVGENIGRCALPMICRGRSPLISPVIVHPCIPFIFIPRGQLRPLAARLYALTHGPLRQAHTSVLVSRPIRHCAHGASDHKRGPGVAGPCHQVRRGAWPQLHQVSSESRESGHTSSAQSLAALGATGTMRQGRSSFGA